MKLGSGQGSQIQLVGLSFPVTDVQFGQQEQQSRTCMTFSPFPACPRSHHCPRQQPSFLTLSAFCIYIYTLPQGHLLAPSFPPPGVQHYLCWLLPTITHSWFFDFSDNIETSSKLLCLSASILSSWWEMHVSCISQDWLLARGTWAQYDSAKVLHITEHWANTKTALNGEQFKIYQYIQFDYWAVRNPKWRYRLRKE